MNNLLNDLTALKNNLDNLDYHVSNNKDMDFDIQHD